MISYSFIRDTEWLVYWEILEDRFRTEAKCGIKQKTLDFEYKSLKEIENNSSWVNLTHFLEKTHLLPRELIFVSSSRRVYMYIKFDIWNGRLEWYKKRSVVAKWTIQNYSDALAAAHIKWKNVINSTWVNFNSFTLTKRTF